MQEINLCQLVIVSAVDIFDIGAISCRMFNTDNDKCFVLIILHGMQYDTYSVTVSSLMDKQSR